MLHSSFIEKLTKYHIYKPLKSNSFYTFRNNKLQFRYYSTNDPFKILGVSPNASKTEIKKAFLKKAKKYHPDLSKNPNANKEFLKIKEAYDLIKDGNYVYTPQSNNVNSTNETPQQKPQNEYSTTKRYQRRQSRKSRNTYDRQYEETYWDNQESEEVFKKHQEEIKKKLSPIFTYIFVGSMLIIGIVSIFNVI